MKELAALANVSVSAVSKAFSDAEDISEETKKHIFKVAKENGCYGKFYKGKYSKPIIAVLCPELNGSSYSRTVEYLRELIEESGSIALISVYHFDSKTQQELIEYYSAYLQVDGIITIGLKDKLKKKVDTPIVSIMDGCDDSVELVKINKDKAFANVIGLLTGLGHKNIAFASEKLTEAKARHFCDVSGLPYNSKNVFRSDKRFEQAGIDCAKQILASKTDYTAIFCAYDDIAYGVIKHLTQQGFRVPEDFSVVGIDDIDTSGYLETALTTIDIRYKEACEAGLNLLNKKIKNRYFKLSEEISFEARLIVRDSTGKAK